MRFTSSDVLLTLRYALASFVFCALLGGTPLWAQDHADVVRQVKAELVAQGFDFHTVSPSDPDGSDESRCGAFEITRRVVNRLRHEGLGFVGKNPGQNGCTAPNGQRYSHDAVMYPDGRTFDILIRSETENIPSWGRVEHDQPPTSWRPPFDADVVPPPVSQPPVSQPPVIVVPPSQPTLDLSHLATKEDVARLEQQIAAVKEDTREIRAGMNRVLKFTSKYILPAALALWGGYAMNTNEEAK